MFEYVCICLHNVLHHFVLNFDSFCIYDSCRDRDVFFSSHQVRTSPWSFARSTRGQVVALGFLHPEIRNEHRMSMEWTWGIPVYHGIPQLVPKFDGLFRNSANSGGSFIFISFSFHFQHWHIDTYCHFGVYRYTHPNFWGPQDTGWDSVARAAWLTLWGVWTCTTRSSSFV